MAALLDSLAERKVEFDSHLAFAKAMEARILDGTSFEIDGLSVTSRELRVIKSGLIIHLYNIVEALMSKAMDEVAFAVQEAPPDQWSLHTLREWLRYSASFDVNGNEESRLDLVNFAARKLLKMDPIDYIKFKKPPGTWSDKVIHNFSTRLNVEFRLNRALAEVIKKDERYGDLTPLEFLARRRNDIAHGSRTFEHGAQDLTLNDILKLAESTVTYMEHAVAAFESFVASKKYLLASP